MHNNFTPIGRVTLPLSLMLTCMLTGQVAAEPKLRKVLRGHSHDHVNCVAFSPDGKTLASGSGDNSIRLLDVPSGKHTATLKGHTGIVRFVASSPDGKTLASAGYDNTTKLWDVDAGKKD